MFYTTTTVTVRKTVGFYEYSKDKRGRPVKVPSQESIELLAKACAEPKAFEKEEIIARTMIPMINEVVRCIEEGIVASAEEADMGLIYGLGFPPFRGGPIRYLETIGLAKFVEMADSYAHLGAYYQVTDGLREMAASGKSFFKA